MVQKDDHDFGIMDYFTHSNLVNKRFEPKPLYPMPSAYNFSLLRPQRKSIFPYASYLPPQQQVHQPPPSQFTLPRPLPLYRHHKQISSPPRFCATPPLPKTFNFTTSDVDAVLYGYLGDENNKNSISHSLSGVLLDAGNKSLPSLDPRQNISFDGLPASMAIKEISVDSISHKGVFANQMIERGARFGPYKGTIVKLGKLTDYDRENSWELFNNGQLLHYISASPSSSKHCWMKLVNCARYNKEQNMQVIQKGIDLYYETTEDIKAGHELLVWYGTGHIQYMGLPISLKKKELGGSSPPKEKMTEKKLIPIENTAVSMKAGSFPCDRCGKIFSYEYYREKHLKYTRCVDKGDRKFPCHLCQRSFEKKDRLRIHILHVHQKYRPHLCKTCGKRFSQSSSLNKHSRVHTGERPYTCPHCPKAFTASSILRTHLRQHNGERPFKCKFCGKAFASHAAHDSHVRRTHEKLKTFACQICMKTFSMEFELNFHLSTHTRNELEKLDDATRRRAYSERSDSSLIIDIETEDVL